MLPTVVLAAGALAAPAVVGHAGHATDGVGRAAVLALPAALLLLTAEAALAGREAVVPAVEATVPGAAVRALIAVAALPTGAVPEGGVTEGGVSIQSNGARPKVLSWQRFTRKGRHTS